MESILFDLKYALRGLMARPGFTVLAALTLAIGIGVNTVAFSAFNGLLLKPFSFKDADRLGWIMVKAPGNHYGNLSLADYEDIVTGAQSFDAIIAEGRMPLSVRLDGVADEAWGMLVSTNYLETLGVRPELGRLFTGDDLRSSELPVLVSHRFWHERLGGGDSLAGRQVLFNGRSYAVIGVVPDGFQGPGGLFEPDAWLPLERAEALNLPGYTRERGHDWLTVVGRLKPGVRDAQGQAELQAIMGRLAIEYPQTNKDTSAAFYPMRDGHPEVRGIATAAYVALGAVGTVLLIACFNVAGLLLARASERRREIGVRAALGASRARIVRQLITEGTLLAVISGIAALVVAAWSADLLSAFSLPAPIPQRLHMGIDRRLVLFTAAMVAIAGVLPAIVPSLQATRADLLHAIRQQSALGGRPSRARNLFVIAQVAGSTLFLAAALLFVRSFWNTADFDPGFDAQQTLVLELNPTQYGYDVARSKVFFDNLHERLEALPGARAVALGDRVPFFIGFPKSFEISADGSECATTKCRSAVAYSVGAGYFTALGIPLTAGRDFTEEETRSGNGVVVSAAMAAQFWPGENPVGRSFRYGTDGTMAQVIGIAADIKYRNMAEKPTPFFYRPIQDAQFGETISVVIRAHDDPRALIGAVQQQVHALDPNLPARSVQPMSKRMEIPLWPARTAAGFFLICGTLALVLATVGLFGVTYYAVSQRTREFGVRMALGATPSRVVALVLREGLMLTMPGVILGIAGALIVTRILAGLLFGISAADPLTYAVTAVLQACVALAACAFPAYRATRVAPLEALRAE